MATSSVADCARDAPPSIASAQPLRNGDEVEDDDDKTCRICRDPGSTDDPLRYPCACRGSIRFVHEKCLLQWLNHGKTKSCEICKHSFSFTPIYAESTPSRLPFHEIFLLASAKAISSLQFFLRLCFVILTWIFVLPFITFRIWLFTLARSLSDTTNLFSGHLLTPVEIFTDSLLGILLIIALVVVARVGTHLLKYVIYLVKRGSDSHEVGNQHGRLRMYGPVVARGPNYRARDIGRENGGLQMNGHDAADLAAPAQVEGLEDESFEKYVGLKGPIHDLLKNCILVLARNAALLGILSFVPFSLGRMFLYYLPFTWSYSLQYKQSAAELRGSVPNTKFVKPPNLSDLSAIMVGYTSILSAIIIYISFKNANAVTGGIRKLFMSFRALLLDVLRALVDYLKLPLVILVETVVFPFIFGWCIDVFSVGLLGGSIDLRLRYFLVDPARAMYMHILLGFVYLFLISSFIEDVQEVLNYRAVHFLFAMLRQGPEAIDILLAKTACDHVFRLLLLFSIYGSSIVLVVHMPIRLIMQLHLASFIFPLNFETSALHAQFFLFLVYIPIVATNCKYPRSAIRVFLRHWFAMVGRALNLTSTLLPTDLRNRNSLLARRDSESLHGDSDAGKVDELNQAYYKYKFLFPVMLLVIFAWINILLFSSAMIVVPALIGRVIFDAIPHPSVLDAIWECDLFALGLGFYISRRWLVMATLLISSIRSLDVFSLVSKTWEWCTTDLKNMLFYFVWISGVPLMIGVLFNYLVLPLTININESLLFLELQECWAFGAYLLKITALCALGELIIENGSFGAKFVRMELYVGGFRGNSALTEVIVPVFSHLLTALCLPYVLANIILPVMGFTHLFRYAWIGFLALRVVCVFIGNIPFWVKKFHDCLKDDRYLTGRRLSNYGEE